MEEFLQLQAMNYGDGTSDDTEPLDSNLRNMIDKNETGKVPQEDRRRKLTWKVAKSVGRGIYKGAKIATVATGTLAGAGIGLAAGVATGQPSKAFTYAATGAGIGAVAGKGLAAAPESGKNLAIRTVDIARDKLNRAEDTFNETMYGRNYARQKQIERDNARARNRFLKDKDQQEKYKEMMGKLGYKGNQNDFMRAAFDLKEAGVKSDDMIENALGLEMKRDKGEVGGKSHENVIDVASFAEKNGYGKDYIEDAKKRESMEGVVQSVVPGEDAQMAVMETFAELYDRKDYYKKHSGIRQQNSNNTTNNTSQQGNTPAAQPRRRGRPAGSTNRSNQN